MENQTRVNVVQNWLQDLPMQQQAVLLLACRGCDSVPKDHPSKPIVRMLRAYVLNAARVGRALRPGESGASFMHRPRYPEAILSTWRDFEPHVEALPMHYVTHLMHAIEILGYKYPSAAESDQWLRVYAEMAHAMHLNCETRVQMDDRLSDWGREYWGRLGVLDEHDGPAPPQGL